MIKGIYTASRFVIILAIIGTFVGSIVLLIAATLATARLVREQLEAFGGAGLPTNKVVNQVDHLGVQFIQITDIILLGTVLYIVSLGLYQLFVDDTIPVPEWLRVRDLIELKRDLIGVTVVLLGVTFLGEVVDWNRGDMSILALGAAVALVVAALGMILWLIPEHPQNRQTSREPKAADQGTGEAASS